MRVRLSPLLAMALGALLALGGLFSGFRTQAVEADADLVLEAATATPSTAATTTATATPSATTEQPVLIRGALSLQTPYRPPSLTWRADLLLSVYPAGSLPGDDALAQLQIRSDDAGSFETDGLSVPPGSYDVAVKARGALSSLRRNVSLARGDNHLDFGELPLGDIQDDDLVDIFDATLLAGQFNRAAGQPGFDARADLNGDGTVNLFDLTLLAANWGREGQRRWLTFPTPTATATATRTPTATPTPTATSTPAPTPWPNTGNPRFGAVAAGPSVDNPQYLSAAMSLLGAGSWFSFWNHNSQVVGRVEMVRPKADLAVELQRVADQARAYPGRAWIVGNEPNVPGQDDLQPAAYSDFLHQTAAAIKGADPSARLVGPNVLNWDKTCNGCAGYTAGHVWSDAFLADYRARYGPLPFDVWGMHVYTIDWVNLPMVDAPSDQAQLAAARSWLDANGLDLPIWLTEFGVIWGYEGYWWMGVPQSDGSTRWYMVPSGQFREDLLRAYLDSMLAWLDGPPGRNARVEKLFLYGTSPPPEPYTTEFTGISLLQPGQLTITSFGELFRTRASQGGGS